VKPVAGQPGAGSASGLVLALDIGATKTLLTVRPSGGGADGDGWTTHRSGAGASGKGTSGGRGSGRQGSGRRGSGRRGSGPDGLTAGHSPVVRFPTERDPEALVARIAAEARSAAAGRPIVAAGCAAPGPLERGTSRIVHSPNLGWHDLPLGDLLADRLGVPVAMDDDAAAGALGESRFGVGRGADPFAYVTVTSGGLISQLPPSLIGMPIDTRTSA